jgi:hypothetical protein
MKIHPSLFWVKPFLASANGLVSLKNVLEISAYKVPLSKQSKTDAQLITYTADATHKIMINTHWQKTESLGNGKFKNTRYKRVRLNFMLDSLAHELAHIKYWDHSPNHLRLQAKLLSRMANIAKQLGIEDLDRPVNNYKKLFKEKTK